jgi:16S rRNA (cytidine1402-2'-O)-methyltransferase
MPLVADPGYRLVQAALAAGIAVQAVPGPSAVITALAASGLPTDEFRFLGFLPPKHGQRRRLLESLRDDPATLVFYEAPHRILETLADLAEMAPGRPAVVAREITKLHEEYLRGSAAEILATLRARPAVKGEITLLVGKSSAPAADTGSLEEAVAAAEAAGMSHMDAVKTVARRRGLPKRAVYSRLLRQ